MMNPLYLLLVIAACTSVPVKPAEAPQTTDPVPAPVTEPVAHERLPASPSSEPAAPGEPAPSQKLTPPDPAQVKTKLLAAEAAAFENAKPVFDKYCAKCHTKTGSKAKKKKLDHFDMTTYPFGGHHATEIAGEIRKSLGIDGSKPTMPFENKGAVQGDELALIAAWADAFDASRNGGAHEGRGHAHGRHKH